MGKYSEKSKEYTARYVKENLEEFKIRVPKGRKAYYKTAADTAGQSLNAFAINAMDEKIEHDHLFDPSPQDSTDVDQPSNTTPNP